jgi:hypothetical protein
LKCVCVCVCGGSFDPQSTYLFTFQPLTCIIIRPNPPTTTTDITHSTHRRPLIRRAHVPGDPRRQRLAHRRPLAAQPPPKQQRHRRRRDITPLPLLPLQRPHVPHRPLPVLLAPDLLLATAAAAAVRSGGGRGEKDAVGVRHRQTNGARRLGQPCLHRRCRCRCRRGRVLLLISFDRSQWVSSLLYSPHPNHGKERYHMRSKTVTHLVAAIDGRPTPSSGHCLLHPGRPGLEKQRKSSGARLLPPLLAVSGVPLAAALICSQRPQQTECGEGPCVRARAAGGVLWCGGDGGCLSRAREREAISCTIKSKASRWTKPMHASTRSPFPHADAHSSTPTQKHTYTQKKHSHTYIPHRAASGAPPWPPVGGGLLGSPTPGARPAAPPPAPERQGG